jgi:hypothetical protein
MLVLKRMTGLLLLLSATGGFAQKDQKDQKDKDNEFSMYAYKARPQDRILLEMNHTGWLGMPHGLKEKATTGGFNFYLYFDHPIKNSHFSFAWGAGMSSHNIHGPINLVYHVDSLNGNINYTSIERRKEPYKVNRIGFKLVEVPVELRFRTWTNYQFKAMLGFKAGYVVQTFRKIFDKDGKVKIYDIYGTNPLRYGITLRLGWEQIHLTGFYALSEVFLKGKGQKGIIPFSFGIAYTPRIGLGSK